jgi:hypothetical protein
MKNAAVISATLAILIFMTVEVDAAEFKIDSGKNFVEQKRFIPPIRIPHRDKDSPEKFYTPRYPVRPKPRYTPSKPGPSRDNRGGGRRKFGPPQHHSNNF